MKKSFHAATRFVLMSFAVITIISTSVYASAKQERVAIIPFKINAQEDMAFLKDGILSMLSSRLSWEKKVVVINRQETEKAVQSVTGPLNEKKALKIGAVLEADYVLFGSLTIFGNSVSLDSKMLDVSEKKEPLSFYNQSHGIDEVIPKINLFAEAINEKVFGRKTAVKLLPERRTEEEPSIYAHPERMLSGAFIDDGKNEEELSPFIISRRAGETKGFHKSRNLKMQVKGLALGDVDGDGKTETVIMLSQKIIVYRFEKNRFLKIKEIVGEKRHHFISVDVADIKRDDKAEIFVTCLNTNSKKLESFVLEWNGNDFEYILKNENIYYRALVHPERGHILFGQKKGVSDLFLSGVYELAWSGGRYELQDRVSLPKETTVFSFALGDVMNNGSEMTVVFDEEDRLRIFSHNGEQEWKSEDRYGGSENYLDTSSGKESEDRIYLPHRIFVTDLDKNGKTEVVVVKNHSLSSRLFKRYRRYSGGEFASLSWDGLGLAQNWSTRKASGYFADYAIGDIDNDGEPELAVAVASKRGSIMQKAKSSIIFYELGTLSGEKKE